MNFEKTKKTALSPARNSVKILRLSVYRVENIRMKPVF